MIALFCLFVCIHRIGRLAIGPGREGGGAVRQSLAFCTGVSLFLLSLCPVLRAVPLSWAIPLGLVGALAIGSAIGRLRVLRADERRPVIDRYPRGLEVIIASVVALISVRGYFFDELDHHLPITQEILRGLYPPPYPFLPAAPFSYYFGFNVLAATVSRVSGMAPWYAFDVLTVLFTVLMMRLIWGLGNLGGVRKSGTYAVLLTILGGGLAWVHYPVAVARMLRVDLPSVFALPFYHLEYHPWHVPPIVSYLFQHPMALGMPLWLSLLWVVFEGAGEEESARHRFHRALILGILLGALGASQTVLFYFTIPLLVVAGLVRRPWTDSLRMAVISIGLGLVLTLLVGVTGSGMVTVGQSTIGLRWPPRLGWGESRPFPGYLDAFGIPTLLGIAGGAVAVRRGCRGGIVLSVALLAGLAGPHMVELRQNPWDTVKLFVPAALAAGILGGWLLAWFRERRTGACARWTVGLILVTSSVSPGLFLWVRAWGPLGIDENLPPIPLVLLPPPAGGLDRTVGEWISVRASSRDVILTGSPYVTPFSGVPSFAPQEHVWGWYRWLDRDGRYRRDLECLWQTLSCELVDRYGIRWVVIGPTERGRLGSQARRALEESGRFSLVHTVGDGTTRRMVYRTLLPDYRSPAQNR